jgi:uncharacterized protein
MVLRSSQHSHNRLQVGWTPRKVQAWRRPAAVVVLAVLVGIAVVYGAMSVYIADRLSQPSRRPVTGSPADVGLSFEPVEFSSVGDGITLRGWWIPAAGSDRAVIIVHGRGSNRAGAGLMGQARDLSRAGYNVLSFDLRAHGESSGKRYSLGPVERQDVMGALGFVRSRGVPAGHIGLVCHSMGAAICLLTAPQATDVAAVVSDSAYARLSDLLAVELPKNSGLPAAFNPGILLMGNLLFGVDADAARPEAVVAQIAPRPVLFIHSETDTTIPADHARRLWRASNEGADRLWLVSGPLHDRVYDAFPAEYMARVTALFERAIK